MQMVLVLALPDDTGPSMLMMLLMHPSKRVILVVHMVGTSIYRPGAR